MSIDALNSNLNNLAPNTFNFTSSAAITPPQAPIAGTNNIVVHKKKKKKTDEDDIQQQLQTLINSLDAPANSNSNSLLTILANNPSLASLGAATISAAGIIIPKQISKVISKPSKEDIKYTNAVFAELFVDNKPLSPERQKQVLNNLIKFATDPDSIEVPKYFINMHPTAELQQKAIAEYKKSAQKIASAFLFFPIRLFTDLDGTFLSYKAADFVSSTGISVSTQDREAILTFAYLLSKLNIGLKDYFKIVHNKTDFTSEELQSMETALNTLSMRGVLFEGTSIYGVYGKKYRVENGELIIEQRAQYLPQQISAWLTEIGADANIIKENPRLLSLMSLNGFGGLVTVTSGKEINIKGDLKAAAQNMQKAINDQSSDWKQHFNSLLNLRGEEFIKAYQPYLSGDKQNIKMGFLHEITLIANAFGLQVFENKTIPSYMLDPEWEAYSNIKPRYDHALEIAVLIDELKKNNNSNWKNVLRDKLTPLSQNEAEKFVVPQKLYDQINASGSIQEFGNKFNEGSSVIITLHAINGSGNFKNPNDEVYDLYKNIIEKAAKKYCPDFAVANNGGRKLHDAAPYLEIVGAKFNKADALDVSNPLFYPIFSGDSQSTDLGAAVAGVNNAWLKKAFVTQRFDSMLEQLSQITGTDQTKMSEEQKERLVSSLTTGLGIAPRGQIDLGNEVAIGHYAQQGQKFVDGPFGIKKEGSQYKLIGEKFGSYKGEIVSEDEFKAVTDKKANSSNKLYKALQEKAVPFYKESIARFADTSHYAAFLKHAMCSIFGIDGERLDSQTLYDKIIPKNARTPLYHSGLLQPYDGDMATSLYKEVFDLKPQNNPHGPFAQAIFRAPYIGSTIALIGAGMSGMGVMGKLYDSFSHNQKFEDAFGDVIAKGFSLANFGLALSTVLIKTQFYPLQLIGALIGMGSGFLPAGNIQQYLALASMGLSSLGSAREMSFFYGSRIDYPSNNFLDKAMQIFNKKDLNLKSGPDGIGPTYLDPKVFASDANDWAESLHEGMTKWLFKNLKLNPKIASQISKFPADIAWNIRELGRTVKNPSLLRFGSFTSATNGFEYHHAPFSWPHFFNMAGFASLGLLGLTASIQAFNHISQKNAKEEDQDEFQNINEQFNKNLRLLTDPRSKHVKQINKDLESLIPEPKKDDKNNSQNLAKLGHILGAASSLIPAAVFLLQGLQIKQNALATRRSFTGAYGEQVTYHPGAIGTGLVLSSGLQSLAAIGTGLAGTLLTGQTAATTLNISNALYNLFAAASMAFMGANMAQGGGGSLLYMRNFAGKNRVSQYCIPSLTYNSSKNA